MTKPNILHILIDDLGCRDLGCCGLSTAEGCPTSNLPMVEGKGWMYEGGTRVCQIMRRPGVIEPGSSSGVPVQSCDFYPTYLAAAGLDPLPEQHCDGVDLAPLLRGESELDRDAIYWHYPHYGNQGGTPGCSIRAGDWKLIEFFEDGKLALYNLREDLSETTNLAAEKPERTAELHGKLVAWREEVRAAIPRPNPEYARLRAEFEAEWDGPEV